MCPYLFISLLSGLCITLSWMQPKLWPVISLIRLWVPGRRCGTYLLLVVPAVSGQCSEGEGHSAHLAIGMVELDDVKETHDSLTMSKVEWTMDPTASGLVSPHLTTSLPPIHDPRCDYNSPFWNSQNSLSFCLSNMISFTSPEWQRGKTQSQSCARFPYLIFSEKHAPH